MCLIAGIQKLLLTMEDPVGTESELQGHERHLALQKYKFWLKGEHWWFHIQQLTPNFIYDPVTLRDFSSLS